MEKLTASNIVSFINQLDRNCTYNYINPKTKTLVKIVGIDGVEGPIRIIRWNPHNLESPKKAKVETISTEMIWRVANAFNPNQPINFDRVLAGSYNTRSALEALLAHTPDFYFCYPGRIESLGGTTKVKGGHKHIIWRPDQPHKNGVLQKYDTDMVISEIPQLEAIYDSLATPAEDRDTKIDIDIDRRHAQIQIALYFIGLQLNYRTWVAQNDKGIIYQKKRLGEYDGIIVSLKDEKLLSSHSEAIKAALMIDCIWFKNGRLMPAVMEIEHSTGVTSGLSRMLNFKTIFPPFATRYVIVAPDEERGKVVKEANKLQFKELDTRFFSYSSVEELYALCKKRKLKGITEEFLDCYMEKIISDN